MKFRIARNITQREIFEFQAPDAEAARAAVRELNRKIIEGEEYDVEDLKKCHFVDEITVSDQEVFELTGWEGK